MAPAKASRRLQRIEVIYLYDEPDAAGLDIADIGAYLATVIPGVRVETRRDYITHQFARFSPHEAAELEREVTRQLQRAWITDPWGPGEQSVAADSYDPDADHILDAAAYQAILRLLVAEAESGAEHLHVVFTAQQIGTWRAEEGFARSHILCMGEPSLISVTGFVEALPRPREYEFRRAQLAMLGLDEEALEDLAEDFADRTFGYGDPRINEVCKGYALMACFYRVFAEAFCDEPSCRLHAARTQEELIAGQCGRRAGLCKRHQAMRAALNKS